VEVSPRGGILLGRIAVPSGAPGVPVSVHLVRKAQEEWVAPGGGLLREMMDVWVVRAIVHGLIALFLAELSGQPAFFSLAVVMFLFLGFSVVSSEALGIRFTRVPVPLRWAIHGMTIWGCYRLAEYLVGG
jgi:hypothetical protein